MMMRVIFALLTLILLIACKKNNEGQKIDNSSKNELNTFLGDEYRLRAKQEEISLEVVDKIINDNSVLSNELDTVARRIALYTIDQILHVQDAASSIPVQKYYHDRIEKVIKELKDTKVEQGMKIWKLYNDGFIVKTATVTVCFDFIRGVNTGSRDFALPNELAKQIVDQCDILFVSHYHIDHADEWVAQTFLDEGKPVVAPPDIWENEAVYSQVTHLDRDANILQKVKIQNSNRELEVVIYPGRQGDNNPPDPLNNVVLVITPENLVFVHTGDQSSNKDWGWIDHIKDQYTVDVLMTNSWYQELARVVNGITPKKILSGHENELGHSIDHREPYWLSFVRLKNISIPNYVLTWGESYYYNP